MAASNDMTEGRLLKPPHSCAPDGLVIVITRETSSMRRRNRIRPGRSILATRDGSPNSWSRHYSSSSI